MKRMDVACSLAMIGREMFEDLRVFTFSNELVEVPGRRGFALRDAITGSQPHGGTELGKAVGSLPARDRLIVITDEQSHDPVPQLKGYMINVASNKNGVGYGRWIHIDGWSDSVLDYIAKYEANASNDA
jgi:60 kDa SS-A/Ro ribonucleoprotein